MRCVWVVLRVVFASEACSCQCPKAAEGLRPGRAPCDRCYVL